MTSSSRCRRPQFALALASAVALIAFTGCAILGCGHSSPMQPTPTPSSSPAAFYDVSRLGVPKFVNSLYIDLSQIDTAGAPIVNQISLFRSSAGHDYSDSFETCRSMKHDFRGADAATRIFAPVAGAVVSFDVLSSQMTVQADAQPAFWFTVFHPVFVRTFAVGEHVSEGEYLGTHVRASEDADIAVLVNPGESGPAATATGIHGQLVSYFETLTDAAFAPLRQRGIASPADLIITRAQRDAAPLTCTSGGEFVPQSDPRPQFVRF